MRWRTEVGLPGHGELRSWDAVLTFPTDEDAVEAESRIRDFQATFRRASRKLRDDPGISHLILLVADTPGNRRVISEARELVRTELPLDTRAILTALGAGRCPGAGGIVFL